MTSRIVLKFLCAAVAAIPMTALGDKNWGKWGADDQLGTLNYITPEVRVKAATLVRSGESFNVAIDIKKNQPAWPGRPYQYGLANIGHSFTEDGTGLGASSDFILMHLQGSTQWDGFAHFFYDQKMYNGVPSSEVTSSGAKTNSIHLWSDRLVTRGVLLDVAKFKNKEFLDKGYIITPEDLEGAASMGGVQIESGDCLLVRTGWIKELFEHPWPMKDRKEAIEFGEPGLGYAATQWLQEKQVACVAVDNLAVEAIPFDPEGIEKVISNGPKGWPVHVELLVNQGMPIGEVFDFEALAAACAADGHYAFLFAAPPLRFVGGIGTPISPVAVK